MDDLEGKVAVVTGAASGIGRALADRWVTEGMKVVLADVEEGPLDAARDELDASGADVLAVRTDVSDRGAGRRPGRGHARPFRCRAPRVQQRRRGRRWPHLGGRARGVGLGAGRQPPRGGPRHQGLRPPPRGPGRGARGEHGVHRRVRLRPDDGPLQRVEGRGRGHLRDPEGRSGPAGLEGRRERALPGLGQHPHPRVRPQPPRRSRGQRRDSRRVARCWARS